MGFKKIDLDELKTKMSQNFLGVPLREGGKLVQKSHREKKIELSYTGSLSEVLILNEEFLEFQYNGNGKRKSVNGNGTISIFNNSLKDRIWDSNLQFSGSQFNNQNEENNIDLGIFEPSSNKVLKYEIVNSDDLPNIIKLNEDIKVLNEDFKLFSNNNEELSDEEILKIDSPINYLLLLGKENKVRFSITLVNVSNSMLEKIKFKKSFAENFYNFEFKSNKSRDFKINRRDVECFLNNLAPREEVQIIITANILPKKKENIKTGKIEINFTLSNKVLSGISINHFSAYSHVMHAIKKTEKNDAPNHWDCLLIFENRSEFKMKLKSILICDEAKSNKLLELDFNATNNLIINPHGKYKTKSFDFISEKDPTFSRKVEYSVEYKTESNSMITSKFEESTFKVVNIDIKKNLSEKDIKSFEETKLSANIIISNHGTVPIKGLRIIERIPEDFLPSRNLTDFMLYKSSGKLEFEDIELNLSPDDDDPSHEHIIELNINLKNNGLIPAVQVGDFLELKYPMTAMTPDYKKDYNFPLEVHSFYPKYENYDEKGLRVFYTIIDNYNALDKSTIKVSHKRRKILVGKEIFPGRNNNEFAIYIIARNGSNTKISEVDISDTFPDSFELISSNVEYKLSKSKNIGKQKISFTIDTLLPYQEKEIMYYLKIISGKEVKQSELESYFIG